MNPVVIGGGFSGLAAACRLAGDGHHPVLIERSPQLGGRAASFRDRSLDETVDLGHHILMGCCTAARGFLRRIDAEHMLSLQPTLSIPVRCGARLSTLRSTFLPGPFHLLPSLLRYAPMRPADRFNIVPAALALLATGEHRLEPMRFARWLKHWRQSATAIARLWDPICIAALNAPVDAVSARAARMVFADAFFRPGGANLGCFNVPLFAIASAASEYIRSRGGVVETGTAVDALSVIDGAVRGVQLSDGRLLEASAVVSSVPPDALAALLADDVPGLNEIVHRGQQLSWSAIINVHLWFDRPVMEMPFFIAVDAPIQAVFDVSRLHGARTAGRSHIVVSQSAAADWMSQTNDAIVSMVRTALAEFVPATSTAKLIQVRVVRQPRATFVSAPGTRALRPPAATPISGLTLAGDWTQTGWPSTLEGAVRSGVAAAARLNLEPSPSEATQQKDHVTNSTRRFGA